MQASLAAEHWARVLKRTALACWALYHAASALKRQRWLSALVLCSRQRLRRALLRWRDTAHAAALLRRMEAVEGEACSGPGQEHDGAGRAAAAPR